MAGQQSGRESVKSIPPLRVHITYDVETGGATEKGELPLVVGILANLSGNVAAAQPTGLPALLKTTCRSCRRLR